MSTDVCSDGWCWNCGQYGQCVLTHIKSLISGKRFPPTLTVFEHEASMTQTQSPPSAPSARLVAVTGLCKDVACLVLFCPFYFPATGHQQEQP